MKARGKYLFSLTIALVSLFYACERIEPVDVDGEGNPLSTIMAEDLTQLDTVAFSYIGLVDQQYIFEFEGSPKLPGQGDLIYFHDSLTQVFGEVSQVLAEGQVMRLSLSVVSLDKLFEYMAVKNDLSLSEGIHTRYLNAASSLDSDTVRFEPVEMLWDFGSGIWGLLKLDSLLVYNELDGVQQYYLGPVWKDERGTRRIDLSIHQDHHLSAALDLVIQGDFDIRDSLKVRERLVGPYFADGFPLYYQFKEWVIIEIKSEGNNKVQTHFCLNGLSKISTQYQPDKGWDISKQFMHGNEIFDSPTWDMESSYEVSISLKTVFKPLFCGEPGLEVISHDTWGMSTVVEWPNWTSLIYNEVDFNMQPDNTLFRDIPSVGISEIVLSRDLFSDGGELENQAPIPDFTISPSSGFTDTNFKFDASKSSDFEDDPSQLQVRWDFDGDLVWNTNFSVNKEGFYTYQTPGNYNVIMEVMDTQGEISFLLKSVVVQETSSAPVASFTVTPEEGRTSDVFIFDASASYDYEDEVHQLKVRWDFDGDDVWDTEFSHVKAAYWPFREPGEYTAKLEVKDTQGLSSTTTRFVKVEAANIKPIAIFSVTPEEGDINTRFRFDASESSDVEDDVSLLLVRWDFDNDAQWDTDYRSIKTIDHIFPTANNYTVVLQVMDTDEYSTLFSKDVLVTNPNTRPTAKFSISPPTGNTTVVFTFDARISEDLEDSIEELQFRWDWDNNGVYDTEFLSTPLFEKTFSEPGTKLIKLQVKYSGGLTDTKTDVLIVE